MAGASKLVKRTVAKTPEKPGARRLARMIKTPALNVNTVAKVDRPRLPAPVLEVSLGTDCSGLETVATCLESLHVQVNHVFSCELNPKLREFIALRFSPSVLYPDMKMRNNSTHNPTEVNLDLYVVGLACQPFSKAGKNAGARDTKDGGRGNLFNYAADWIENRLPKAFILENVENLIKQHTATFKRWLRTLRSMLDGAYNVYWRVLATDEHGLPQRRRRVYIVGLRADIQNGPFEFPEPVGTVDLNAVLDPAEPTDNPLTLPTTGTAANNVMRAFEKVVKHGLDITAPAALDQGSTHGSLMTGAVPTLTASRCSQGGYWLLHRGRLTTQHELLRLQGLPPRHYAQPEHMTRNQLNFAIGNAMSGNVLTRVLAQVINNIYGPVRVSDPWACPAQAVKSILF